MATYRPGIVIAGVLFCFYAFSTQIASAGILHVRPDATGDASGSDWENASTSISAALEVASYGDEIWVAAGTYQDNVELKPGIPLLGGFTGNETLVEERDWARNETSIQAEQKDQPTVQGADEALIDGFTISGSEYAGLLCDSASPLIQNCTISNNIRGSGYSSGILCNGTAAPQLTNCMITRNFAYESTLLCQDASSPNLINCIIMENEGIAGAAITCDDTSKPVLQNCIIMRNVSSTNGTVYCKGDSFLTLINCTMVWNYGDTRASGVQCQDSASLSAVNCIFWDLPGIDADNDNEKISVTWSNIRGGFEGIGNIDAEPGFMESWTVLGFDLRLIENSPCVDAGNPDSKWNDSDLPPGQGGARCDMGAYGGPLNHAWINPEDTGIDKWLRH